MRWGAKLGACGVLLLAIAPLVVTTPATARPRAEGRVAASVACRAGRGAGTTQQATVVPAEGTGVLTTGPGEAPTSLGWAFDPSRLDGRCPLVSFVQLTDFQAVDEESPARVEFLDATQQAPGAAPFSAAYRPQESLSTQLVEAMVRQVRTARSSFSGRQPAFAVLTGDNADNQQLNETRWFVDLLDGGHRIEPDSGLPTPACPHGDPGSVYDGPRGGGGATGYYEPDGAGDGTQYTGLRDFPDLLERAQKPFDATGLGMPWYSAVGNHDALVQGNSPSAFVGPLGPGSTGPDATQSSAVALQAVATGCTKPTQPGLALDLLGALTNPVGARTVPPDPRRCLLAGDDEEPSAPGPCAGTSWIDEHFATTGVPVGHGYAPGPRPDVLGGLGRPAVADRNDDGYYSYRPAPGFRFVVLDTITHECGSDVCAEGSIDDPQFQWLGAQLAAAEARQQYVVVFSHHTEATTRFPSTDPTEAPLHFGTRDANPATTETLEELLCSHQPTVLAHVDGHTHENTVVEHRCDELTAPGPGVGTEGSYWELSTSSHLDWPQQSRFLEILPVGRRHLALVATMIDHAGPVDAPTSGARGPIRLASIARELAYGDPQSPHEAQGDPADRNVIIGFDRPPPG